MSGLYDKDFHAWAMSQANLLRSGKVNEADLLNIAEEIESMGRSEKRELLSRLIILMMHVLKWTYQPGFRSRSWILTLQEQSSEIELHLSDNPSLNAKLPDMMNDAYRLAVIKARSETGLPRSTFPDNCPWTFESLMSTASIDEDSLD